MTPEGRAYPGERFVRVARELGDNGVIRSICRDSYAEAIDAVVARTAEQRR